MSVIFGRFRRVSVVVLLLLSLTAVMGGGASAQGNSENAKLCQKGNWANLAKAEDVFTAFTNQGACVAYGAQGGDIVDLTTPLFYFDGYWTGSGCSVNLHLINYGLPGTGYDGTTFTVNILKDGGPYVTREWFLFLNTGIEFHVPDDVPSGATLTATATYDYEGLRTFSAAPFTCETPV